MFDSTKLHCNQGMIDGNKGLLYNPWLELEKEQRMDGFECL